MRKQIKWLRMLLPVFVFLCLAGVVWQVITRAKTYRPNPIRPEDFPEILIAPAKARLVDHATPDSGCVPHVYFLCFVIDDPYPSDDTYDFLDKHLSSNGWRRLKYQVLYPHVPPPAPPRVPEFLDPEIVNFLSPKTSQKGMRPCMYRKEDWIGKNEELIRVFMYYSADLATKQVHRDRVYVNLNFFGRESWIYRDILRYKQLHPEEFEKSNDLSKPIPKAP